MYHDFSSLQSLKLWSKYMGLDLLISVNSVIPIEMLITERFMAWRNKKQFMGNVETYWQSQIQPMVKILVKCSLNIVLLFKKDHMYLYHIFLVHNLQTKVYEKDPFLNYKFQKEWIFFKNKMSFLIIFF